MAIGMLSMKRLYATARSSALNVATVKWRDCTLEVRADAGHDLDRCFVWIGWQDARKVDGVDAVDAQLAERGHDLGHGLVLRRGVHVFIGVRPEHVVQCHIRMLWTLGFIVRKTFVAVLHVIVIVQSHWPLLGSKVPIDSFHGALGATLDIIAHDNSGNGCISTRSYETRKSDAQDLLLQTRELNEVLRDEHLRLGEEYV